MKKLLFFALFTALGFAACQGPTIEIPIDADIPFRPFITSYTSGVISRVSPIRLVLKKALPQHVLADTMTIRDAIDVTPKFSYSLNTSTPNVVEIIPAKSLANGKRYRVDIDVAKLINEKIEAKALPIVFETTKQDASFGNVKVEPADIYEPNNLTLTGFVETRDNASLEEVKKTIKSIGKYKLKDVRWARETDRKFKFFVKGISKQAKASNLAIKLDAKAIDGTSVQTKTVTIPAISEFKLSSWNYTSYPDQILTLQFTEPLNTKQNLEGLIEIANVSNFTYSIDVSEVKVYLNTSFTGTTQVIVNKGIRNYTDKKTLQREEKEITIDEPLPTVEMIGEGTILPNSQGLIIPFKTIGLKKVDVNIYKISEQNMLQFLQVNDLDEHDELYRVAEKIKTHTIDLEGTNTNKLKQWTTHGFNMKDLMSPEPGALYRVRFSFSQAYTFHTCESEQTASYQSEYYDYYENSSYAEREEEDQCESYFYYYSTRSKNLLASDIGLIAKSGSDNTVTIVSTNLVTGVAQPNVALKFYNFQQKLLQTSTTNELGITTVNLPEEPYVVIATSGKHKAYLKLNASNANSLSKFETEGITRNDGIDAYFYGERGVWRPGDDIYLSCIINDEQNKMQEGMPMNLILSNPKGQVVSTQKLTLTTKGIINVVLKTALDAPTGDYTATLKAGSHTFKKTLKIEMVRPNRLKIHLNPETKEIRGAENQNIALESAWLHGTPASNLKANVAMVLTPMQTAFSGYKNYQFEDIATSFSKTEQVIFDGQLDAAGKAIIPLKNNNIRSRGKLQASLITKVFEKGGGFSIDNLITTYHPYKSYVGMHIPLNSYGYLSTQRKNEIDLVNVDTDGKLITKKDTLTVKVYKLEWRWWWQHNTEDIASYISNQSSDLIDASEITTTNGKAKYTFEVPEYKWGQYYIQVSNGDEGHRAGQTVFVDYPGSYRNQKEQNNAMLISLKTDKEKYEVGQTAKVSFPTASAGKALISIENDIDVLQTFWVNTTEGTSTFELTTDAAMSPNCYIHISVLQEHNHTKNDKPLRMYGVLPLHVFDKNTVLEPRITMQDEIRPEQNNSITVSEKDGKAMHYTIAIVDEGLLDLTRFKTPQVWEYFNKKRALGVHTWDVYDDVINSFSGKFDNVYSVGGDDEGGGTNIAKANRFKPTVKFLGPFYLAAGEKATHTFKIENYVGSVRAMVVAREGRAFGKEEHTSKVGKPLMLQSNAPRVLTPGDKLKIPVTLFANEKAKLPIKVSMKANEFLSVANPNLTISDLNNGEALAYFEVTVNEKIGVCKIDFTATCANDQHSESVQIPVRMPGFEIDEVQDKTLQPGESTNFTFKKIGWEGTNNAVIEVSQYPSINLGKRLNYLIRYPHGCIEQTTSSVFPQLYLDELMELTPKQKEQIDENITQGIKRLQRFVTMDGGFGYWPGATESSEWGTNYAGHFLLEAKTKGYFVPDHLLDKWYNYQTSKANGYTNNDSKYYRNGNELNQSYRLYTLAYFGKPAQGAMNRLKESGLQSNTAKWRLASAYALAGKINVAKSMTASVSYTVSNYRDDYYTYGSQYRDKAIILECMQLVGDQDKLPILMKEIAERLGSNQWMSTQETAYGLCAFGKVVKSYKGKTASYTLTKNGNTTTNTFTEILEQNSYGKLAKSNDWKVENTGEQVLFVRLINTGTPSSTTLEDKASKLSMTVNYYDGTNKKVEGDEFQFGKDYMVYITIKNPSNISKISNLALTTFFPAGCEIQNGRITGNSSTNPATYEDIRDDKIYTYFDLGNEESKEFSYTFTNSFKGKYLHPGVHCEAMYDASIQALKAGRMIEIK